MDNQMALIKRVHELEEGNAHLRLNLKESYKVCRLTVGKIEAMKGENKDLKIEVAKFRGKNNYKTSRIKRLIKKGLDRMVQIEKLEDDKNKLLKAVHNMAVSQIEINAENAKLKGEAI